MTNPSKPVPPSTPPPSPPPPGPRHPAPSGPAPGRYVDTVFSLAVSLGEDVARVYKPPARRRPAGAAVVSVAGKVGGPVQPDSEGGRAGVSRRSGAVSGFSLPVPLGLPRFEVPSRPGTPSLPPPQPTPQPGPTPHPSPPFSGAADGWMRLGVIEVDVCGGLDLDQVGPAHCGSSAPHRWHDLLNP